MSAIPYTYSADDNVLDVRPVGTVTIQDILEYADDVLARDLLQPGTIEVYDLSSVDDIQFGYSATHRLIPVFERWLERGWSGSVFFVPDDYRFGMIRMIGAAASTAAGDVPLVFIPTRSEVSYSQARDLVEEEAAKTGL